MSENTGLAKLREMPRRGHTGGHREVQLALCQALHALGARQGSAGLAGSQGPFTAPDPVRQAWPGRAWGGPGAVWGSSGRSGSVPGAFRELSESGPRAVRERSGGAPGAFGGGSGRSGGGGLACLPARAGSAARSPLYVEWAGAAVGERRQVSTGGGHWLWGQCFTQSLGWAPRRFHRRLCDGSRGQEAGLRAAGGGGWALLPRVCPAAPGPACLPWLHGERGRRGRAALK